MNDARVEQHPIPKNILLLGTDASGKNYVAQHWVKRLQDLGHQIEVREGRLSAAKVATKEDEDKSRLSLFLEATFLAVFPFIRWMLGPALALLLHWDSFRFKPSADKTFIISHNALRILALLFGYRAVFKKMQPWLRRAVCTLQKKTRAMVIVLDVDHHIRQQRIETRLQKNQVDPFDKYMAADGVRSERIEAWLVELAQDCFQATVIENNNLSEQELWDAFLRACQRHHESQPSFKT